MKLFLEDDEPNNSSNSKFTYNLEVESIIYNRSNLDEEIVEIVGENFARMLIKNFIQNSKFIKSSLDIDDFDIKFKGISLPSVLLQFSCDKLVNEDSVDSTLGRYTSEEYSEQFENEGETETITFKPVRGELKVYLSNR